MKIRMTLTVDVDPEAWQLAYGCDLEDVREDVKVYVAGSVESSGAAQENAIRGVVLR